MTTDTDTDRIAEIRARAEKATPGPWWTEGFTPCVYAHIEGGRPNGEGLLQTGLYFGERRPQGTEDAKFIAESRQDIPYLLDQHAAIQREVEDLRNLRDVQNGQIKHLRSENDRFWATLDWYAGAGAIEMDEDGGERARDALKPEGGSDDTADDDR